MRKEKLEPVYEHCKSYYGKATVIYEEDGSVALQSYSTIVLRLINGSLIRLWDGYSATTMRHINEFLQQFGFPSGSKKDWEALPVFE